MIDWKERYMREVEGLNNEGDPIGGDPPSGLRHQVEALKAAIAAQAKQPTLAKHQPCGCVICTCEHETQCQGCGAKNCGTHAVGQIPNPVYQTAQAQQPTELSDKCKVAASCLTYNDTEKEAVAKHLLLEASQELRRAQAQQESQWISVEERLPDHRNDVLCFVISNHGDASMKSSHLNPAMTGFYVEYEFDEPTEKVTHWMPLPPAPEGGE